MDRLFFSQIRKLYNKLDLFLPYRERNICKDCYICCTAAARQKITDIERDYIENFIKDRGFSLEIMERYEEFLESRLLAYNNSELNNVCPFYDLKGRECIIYPVRPYSCRIYGNYSCSINDLPVNCSYRNLAKTYTQQEFFRIIPFAQHYGNLAVAYKIYNKYLGWSRRFFIKNYKRRQ